MPLGHKDDHRQSCTHLSRPQCGVLPRRLGPADTMHSRSRSKQMPSGTSRLPTLNGSFAQVRLLLRSPDASQCPVSDRAKVSPTMSVRRSSMFEAIGKKDLVIDNLRCTIWVNGYLVHRARLFSPRASRMTKVADIRLALECQRPCRCSDGC